MMTSFVFDLFHIGLSDTIRRMAGGDSSHEGESSHGADSLHLEDVEKFYALLYFFIIFLSGYCFSRFLSMPGLVGEIIVGILLGPQVLPGFLPNPKGFVLLGEIGLYLLVLEAGIDVDLTMMKLIGARGIAIAVLGSILPIVLGLGIGVALSLDLQAAFAAGACFGPTSLGIAMNVLRDGKIVNTPTGQLVVTAAVVDDMLALVLLSVLQGMNGGKMADSITTVIYSIAVLTIGGYLAIAVFPYVIEYSILKWFPEEIHAKLSTVLMFLMTVGFTLGCIALKVSPLVGIFIAGLTFCRDHGVHHIFGHQFKQVLKWLMRIFFSASIGFQVPIKRIFNGDVIWKGLVFALALIGKLLVGLLAPNFNHTKQFTGNHLRDILIISFSMAAEGEFAFVLANYAGIEAKFFDEDIYAAIIFAILLSTIIPPLTLRLVITKFNKKAEDMLEETYRNTIRSLNSSEELEKGILAKNIVFICIQIRCESKWGLLPKVMRVLQKHKINIIDNRSWHPRGIDSTMVNEIYAQGTVEESSVENLLETIQKGLFAEIGQPEAKIKASTWHPGVETEIIQKIDAGVDEHEVIEQLSISSKILNEAQSMLTKHEKQQVSATKEKHVSEILKGCIAVGTGDEEKTDTRRKRRSIRVRTMSTPLVGGDMFGVKQGNIDPVEISGIDGIPMDNSPFKKVDMMRVSLPKQVRKRRVRMMSDAHLQYSMSTELHGHVRKPHVPTLLSTVDEKETD